MKYVIKVEKVIDAKAEENRYPSKETIYEQTFETDEDTILEGVIKAVNQI